MTTGRRKKFLIILSFISIKYKWLNIDTKELFITIIIKALFFEEFDLVRLKMPAFKKILRKNQRNALFIQFKVTIPDKNAIMIQITNQYAENLK